MNHSVRIGALALASLSFTLAACTGRGEARVPRTGGPVTAPIATARMDQVPDTLLLAGTVQPYSRVVIAAKVMGRIRKIAVKEGDVVRTGQMLVKIDDSDLAAALAQAEAAVEAASAAEENAAAQRDRIRDLESRKTATRKNREDAEMAYAVAAAQRRQAESAAAGAKAMREFATLTAPVSGIVTGRHADEGSMAAPGMPILTIEETARMKVEAALPETEASSVRAGTPVEISFDAGGIAPRRATISEVLPAADPTTRTLLARVILDNPDGSLRSGLFARVSVERGTRAVLRVLRSAIVERGSLTGIYVAATEGGSSTARLRWIRTGHVSGDAVEILSGLAEAEEYVTLPPPGIEDGSPLQAAR